MSPEVQQACTQAMRWLSRREYGVSELRRRLLHKGFADDVIETSIRWLQQRDLLSEQRYADTVMRSKLRRGYTPRMVGRQLRQANVDEAVLTQAEQAYADEFDARKACQQLLQHRDPQGKRHSDPKHRRRLIRYLQGRGFELSLILEQVDDRCPDCPHDEAMQEET